MTRRSNGSLKHRVATDHEPTVKGRGFPRNTAEALLASSLEPEGDCLVWTGLRHSWGYGSATISGLRVLMHRVAWEQANGPIPDGLSVLHRCDNPPCCNVAHLFLGTQGDNVADMVRKDRQPRGERHANARLTPDDVRAIRESPLSKLALADRYGMSPNHIGDIRRGVRWKHAQ